MLPRALPVRVVVASAFLALPISCGSRDRDSAAAPESPPREVARNGAGPAVEFDLGRVVRQVHFAYRPAAEGGWEGGHASYAVRVLPDGAFAVTPRHRPREGAGDPIEGAPARLRTVEVARGTSLSGGATSVASARDDGSLAIRSGALAETLANDERGVEQAWAFASRPAGEGDLVVRVRVEGVAYAGRTRGGVHFRDAATGLGVRYGDATWIDARGSTRPVAARWTGRDVELRVPGAAVDAAAYPATLDPTVGPEFGTDNPVVLAEWTNQAAPAVAFDGTNFLVVWVDGRGGQQASNDVYGARVTPGGAVLDPAGIAVAAQPGSQSAPAVTFAGGAYLVVWSDLQSGSPYKVRAARVSPAGAVLDPGGFAVSSGTKDDGPSAVSSDGTNYMVVWQQQNLADYGIRAARVATSGAVLDPGGVVVSDTSQNEQDPVLAFDGTNYLVAWRVGATGVSGALMDKSAKVVAPPGVLTLGTATQNGGRLAVAHGAGTYLVLWPQGPNANEDVYARRVDKAGTLLDAAPFAVSSAPDRQLYPAAAFDGAAFRIGWSDKRSGNYDVYTARVTPAGQLLDGPAATGGILLPATGADDSLPAIAVGSGVSLAAWQATTSGLLGLDVVATRLDGAGKVVDPAGFVVSTAANAQWDPAVAFDGTNHLVVWHDTRGGKDVDLWAARVDKNGAVLDPTGIAVSTAASGQYLGDVAFDGTNYLVVWEDNRAGNGDVYGARVGKTGVLVDGPAATGGIPISAGSAGEGSPSAAFDGTNYLVVWSDWRNPPSDVYAARVSPGGVVLDPTGIAVSTAAYSQSAPDVAFDGSQYLVVWSDVRLGTQSDVYGARVTKSGALVDGPALTGGIPICTAVSAQQQPQVASDGAGFLAVWTDARKGVEDVYGARVSAQGVLLDGPADQGGFAIAAGANVQDSPRVVHAGTGLPYFVVLRDRKNGVVPGEIYGSRVLPSGSVLDPNGVAISVGQPHGRPAAATAGGGLVLVAYDRFVPSPPEATHRVRGRFVDLGAKIGATCTAATDCGSGFCVDGVCCDNACDKLCQACTAAKKGSGADGACGPVADGSDPDAECADDGAPACKQDGSCDGAGKCRLYKKGVACGATQCAGVATVKGPVCDGQGSCSDTAQTDCSPHTCQANKCAIPCAGPSDCIEGFWCDAGACKLKKAGGDKCTLAAECKSGFCADAVCCETACKGQCEACAESGAEGKCVAVKGKPKGGRPACAAESTPCGGACELGNPVTCTYPGATTTCATSCADGKETVSSCDGQGACKKGDPKACSGNFACDGTAKCRAICAADAECQTGYGCAADGKCVPKAGATCDGDHTTTTPDGKKLDCSPYRCEANGTCRQGCASAADCVAPNVCDAAGKCVAAPASGGEQAASGCGCRAGGDGGRGGSGAALLAAWAGMLARRRRRSPTRPTRSAGSDPVPR